MSPHFCHRNTDLVLQSDADVTGLVAELTTRRLPFVDVSRGDNGRWYVRFEVDAQLPEPETVIALMLDAVESLSPPLRAVWDGCSPREFDIGYDCGEEPWAFNQGLSAGLLRRVAAAGASIRITLYRWTGDDDPACGAADAGPP